MSSYHGYLCLQYTTPNTSKTIVSLVPFLLIPFYHKLTHFLVPFELLNILKLIYLLLVLFQLLKNIIALVSIHKLFRVDVQLQSNIIQYIFTLFLKSMLILTGLS